MLQIQSLTCPGILSSINLSAGPTDFVGLAGSNGSGKTTLLKCIAGILRNFDGSIRIGGHDTADLPQRILARTVSYVPQIVETRIPYTVMDFMRLSRFPHLGMTRTDPPTQPLTRILDELGVRHLQDRVTGTLSGGELQKVLIAAALAQDTPVVLLDEPASHLDPLRAEELVARLKSLRNKRDRLYVMVSHRSDHFTHVCDRIIALRSGEVMGTFAPEVAGDPNWQRQVYGNGEEA